MSRYINRDLIVKNPMLHTWKKSDLLRAIKEAPTADVKEVRHGKWENFEIPHMMRCSKCGVSDLDIHRTKFYYCPYCGAKMDGERSEDGE